MKSAKKRETQRATNYLDRLLNQGIEVGADTIELERVPEGLEICFLAGGAGVGTLLKDRDLESELIGLIVRRSGLESRLTGKMIWTIRGQDCPIRVEEYDSFGESCFRLKLGKLRPPSRTSRSKGP